MKLREGNEKKLEEPLQIKTNRFSRLKMTGGRDNPAVRLVFQRPLINEQNAEECDATEAELNFHCWVHNYSDPSALELPPN
jgi:hypothetical protein